MEVPNSSKRCNCLRNDQENLGPHHIPFCHFHAPVSAVVSNYTPELRRLNIRASYDVGRIRDVFILQEIMSERQHQDDKYGAGRDMPLLEWWAILSEEYGEAAHDLVDGHWTPCETEPGVWSREGYRKRLRGELIQTAASAVAMIDAIDRGAAI